MKNVAVILGIIAIMTIFSCSGGGGDDAAPSAVEVTSLPSDASSDIAAGEEAFDYSTSKPVSFVITVKDAQQNPVSNATITVSDAKNGDIGKSITNTEGKAEFSVTNDRVNDKLTVSINHTQFEDKSFTVDNVNAIEKVIREVYVAKTPDPVQVTDSDNDGVADENDELPDNPDFVSISAKSFTLAFEDLYPSKGDADFNDLVMAFDIEEFITPDNRVGKIVMTSQVLASGAGYNNQFGVAIMGKSYILIESAKAVLGSSWNAREGEIYKATEAVQKTITFNPPLVRSELAPMPYDPFMIPNSVAGREVHLPSVETTYTGTRLDTDGFPWAVIVPRDWAWPYERIKIQTAYPLFQGWYESQGQQNKDWYLHPAEGKVYPVPAHSGLTAYLLNTGRNNIFVISTAIAAILLLIGALTLFSRRKSRVS